MGRGWLENWGYIFLSFKLQLEFELNDDRYIDTVLEKKG